MTQLSILIPARNEMFLARTVQDILENMRADTEILVALDGEWADPPLEQHERVNVLYLPESVGQRAATNMLAKLARGEWLMKVDAHCAFAPGFDEVAIRGDVDGEAFVAGYYKVGVLKAAAGVGTAREIIRLGQLLEAGESVDPEDLRNPEFALY